MPSPVQLWVKITQTRRRRRWEKQHGAYFLGRHMVLDTIRCGQERLEEQRHKNRYNKLLYLIPSQPREPVC